MISNLVRWILARIFQLPHSLKLRLLRAEPIVIRGNTLHPDLQLLLAWDRFLPKLNRKPPPKARTIYAKSAKFTGTPLPKNMTIQNRVIPLKQTELPIRIYTPENHSEGNCLIFFHGGGCVIGGLDSHGYYCGELADDTKAKVIAVGYRKAPEAKFPIPQEDAYAAYEWIYNNAGNLGINREKILVIGDSAGGYLAASTCLKARDAKFPLPKGQVLIYPMTDLRMITDSHRVFANGFLLTSKLFSYFVQHHISSPQDVHHPKASLILAQDLKGMPPAIIAIAGFDPLQDDGACFGEQLRKEGNQVEFIHHPQLIHGFITMSGVLPAARHANQKIAKSCLRMLQST